jgi:acetyl esterase
MLQTLKVAFLRRYYRYASRKAWHASDVHEEPGAIELPTSRGPLRAHMYEGTRAAERPLVVYFHGGGWVTGDLQTHHAYCHQLAHASGCTVISVEYRLAPEHCFPAAQDDCLAAAQCLAERHYDFGPSNGGMVLAGDSAGGNLAACCALEASGALREELCGALLTYPVVDHYSRAYASYTSCAKGQRLTADLMRWLWDTYLGGIDPEATVAQRAFPIRSDRLGSLPPILLCTVGRDPLRDEGRALAAALREAGVAVQEEHYPAAEHGFACTMGPGRDFQEWLDCCATWLAQRRPADAAAPPAA